MESKLHAAIIAVMSEVSYLRDDKTIGSGGAAYKGISDEKMRKSLQGALCRNRLTVIPTDVVSTVQVDRWTDEDKRQKQQLILTAVVTYKITHADTGESELMKSIGIGIDAADKSAGKALTYALKYALLNLFLIPTGNDADQIHSDDVEVPQKESMNPAHAKWADVKLKIKSGDMTVEKLRSWYSVTPENEKDLNA